VGFSCSGVAIGTGMVENYSENNPWTLGLLNAFACGIILYVGLIDLMMETFGQPADGMMKFWHWFLMCVGKAIMAVWT
jgi:hypothetical protein